ncbi:hypothetical protein Vi05172_g12155 [Venturia inaequalis]|nr:hypothetical protein Vi05172_g12155 [Venturia inaequalis]
MTPSRPSTRRTRRYFDIPQTSQRGKSALTSNSLWAKTAVARPVKETPPSHNSAPTTFLSLPREIRQKILYMSCSLELRVLDIPSGSVLSDDYNSIHYRSETDRCNLWKSSVGNMHPTLQDDFEYVYKKWIEEVDGLLGECEEDSKMLVLSERGRYELEYPHIGGATLS